MYIKKSTPLTRARLFIRIFFVMSFYVISSVLEEVTGRELEFETEFVVLAFVFLFGTYWCGWACPFGCAGYLTDKIRERVAPGLKKEFSRSWDLALRPLKYVWLACFVWVYWSQGISYFDDHGDMYDSTLFSSIYGGAKHYIVWLAPIFIPRFFCRYLCYQKAGYNIIHRFFRFVTISRNDNACGQCGKCDDVCPMRIPISQETKICGQDCVGCYSCVDQDVCPPKFDAISLRAFGFRVRPLVFSLVLMAAYVLATYVVLFVLGIGE